MRIVIVGCGKVGMTIASRLQEEGHEIKTIICVKKNMEGNTVRFAKYVLEDGE